MQKLLVYILYKLGTYWKWALATFGVGIALLLFTRSTTLADTLFYYNLWDYDAKRGADTIPSDPFDAPVKEVTYLPQGWEATDSLWFYNTTQGSDLVPYDFFLEVMQEGSTTEKFRSAANMNKYRYLPQRATKANPDALPLGMVKDEYQGKKYMGFTCAACHSAQVNYKNPQGVSTGIRIDGGPAGADMDQFMWDLEGALYSTLFDNGKFATFSAAVQKHGQYDSDEAVLEDLNRFVLRLQAYNFFNTSKVKDAAGNDKLVPYGYARLDAFGRIYNRVLEHILNKAPLEEALQELLPPSQVDAMLSKLDPVLGGKDRDHLMEQLVKKLAPTGEVSLASLRDALFNSPNAPVSYPFIWDIPQHDYVQWNGIAENSGVGPLGRNTGEVIGVFATLDWAEKQGWSLYAALGGQGLFHDKHISFKSSVNAHNLQRIEERLVGLKSPRWEDATKAVSLPAIDEESKERGDVLFDQHCASCHAEINREDPNRRIVASMQKIDGKGTLRTDPRMAVNSVGYQGYSGILRNWYATTPAGPVLLDTRAPVAAQLARATQNVVATPDPDKWFFTRFTDWAVNLVHSFINDIKPSVKAGDYIPDTTQAPFSSLLAYKARSLNGIWATAPYLHNGSVPTLYHLLLPAKDRPKQFMVGSRELDVEKVGLRWEPKSYGGFLFDTTQPANSNSGHEYGVEELSEQDRLDLVEYLKSL